MDLASIGPGKHMPGDFNVVIEISANAAPIKYEFDKACNALIVDRFLGTSMMYPSNYGFVPQTLAGDGDPVDVLVVTPFPLQPSVVVRCRALGLIKMEDESGIDAKLVSVPVEKVCPMYECIQTLEDLPDLLRQQMVHFFEHYKDLEKSKWVKVQGWGTVDDAKAELIDGIARFRK